ncbi:putative RNA-directed DNA polymerase, eukaryota, reverse transcriptase zinc-binding domain protein, partial [Tanacetum coccineum]
VSRANNDINVIHQPPLLNDLKEGKASEIPFVANGVTYLWGYYLVDEIYPEGATCVKISDHSLAVLKIPNLPSPKPKLFKFFNFLTYKSKFIEVVDSHWNTNVAGHNMFKVVSKLKLLKKLLRKLLHEHGTSMTCDELYVDGLFSKQVSDVVSNNMIQDITNEEIKAAMFDIGDDKASGPDGYSFPVNYSSSETEIKKFCYSREDLMETIQAFLKEYDHIPPNKKCMALLLAEERFLKIKQTMEEEQNQPEVMQELLLKLMNDLQIIKGIQQEKKEPTAQSFTPYWNFSMIDDEEAREKLYERYLHLLKEVYKPKAITPEEPDNSLSMGDEHLDTIPSVENLVQILSEFKGISEDTCDVPVCEDPSTFDALNDHSDILFDSNDDGTSSDDDSYENIDRLITNIESLNDNPTPDHVFKSSSSFPIPITDKLPEFESFHFDLYPSSPRPPPEPPDVEICLNFKPDAPVINNFDESNEDECFYPGGGLPGILVASRVHGIVHSYIRASYPQLHLGNPIS